MELSGALRAIPTLRVSPRPRAWRSRRRRRSPARVTALWHATEDVARAAGLAEAFARFRTLRWRACGVGPAWEDCRTRSTVWPRRCTSGGRGSTSSPRTRLIRRATDEQASRGEAAGRLDQRHLVEEPAKKQGRVIDGLRHEIAVRDELIRRATDEQASPRGGGRAARSAPRRRDRRAGPGDRRAPGTRIRSGWEGSARNGSAGTDRSVRGHLPIG